MVLQRTGFRTVARDVSALQVALSVAMWAALVVAVLYREWYSVLGLLISAVTTLLLGGGMYRWCRDAAAPRTYHAMVIAGASWLVAAFVCAQPFLWIAYLTPDDVAQSFVPAGQTYRSSLPNFQNPLHAVFETMSSFTTGGFTMAPYEPSIGHALLFYRSAMAWLGGAGMIVLSLAIIPRPGAAGGFQLYASEQSGGRVRPSILGTARAIWKIYAGATALVVAFLILAKLVFVERLAFDDLVFDSVNHAMAAIATGGTTTRDNGIAEYDSLAVEIVCIFGMIVGTVSLPLLYIFARDRDVDVLWRDVQFRMMVGVLGFGIPAALLVMWSDPAVSAREGVFQFVSAMSTTGWQTSDVSAWSDASILVVVWGAMFIGGMAGATSGGIKLLRAYIIFRAASWKIKRTFLPAEAVVPFRVGERVIPSQDVYRDVAEAAVYVMLYLVFVIIGMIITAMHVGPEYTLGDVMFEVVSVQTATGMSTGIVNPDMSPVLEVTYILLLWIGRLEIFPCIILLRAIILWNRQA